MQFGQFAIAGVATLLIVGIATSIASGRVGEREAIADARTTTLIKAEGVMRPLLTAGLLAGDPRALAGADRIVRRDVLDEWQRAAAAPDGSEFLRFIEQSRAYFEGGEPL